MIFRHLFFTTRSYRHPFRAGRVFFISLLTFLLLGKGIPMHPDIAHGAPSNTVHVVQKGDTLSDIASKYGISVQQIMDWNNLTGDTIFKGQRLAVASSEEVDTYIVRSGDTLSEIVSRFGVPLSSLRELNNIHGDRIYPDQTLRLRRLSGKTPDQEEHVVEKGETLWKISRHYGLSVSEIKEINGLEDDSILPGMKIRLRKAAEVEETPPVNFEYVVQKGDSLSDIARRFDIGLNLLRQLNELKGDHIYPGQRLQVRPSSLDEAVHIVRSGETLSEIAIKYGVSVSALQEINGIQGSRILVGDKLRIRNTPVEKYIVERGDALWEIARAYHMSLEELMQLNGLSSPQIYPGQELQLGHVKSVPYDTYIVKSGDYLGGIARLYQMSVSDLKKVNNLSDSIIRPGDRLKVNPVLDAGREWSKIGDTDWNNLIMASAKGKIIDVGNGPYYYACPQATCQGHASYFENPSLTPLESYRRARQLWEDFDKEIGKLGRLDNALNGWYFVLDPGHGGLDPGAVVESQDGNGNKVYVVEDEYVFDFALRVYVLLRLHGANVTMTLLSPNHLIRHSDPPISTFVNEKNEVYNSPQLNKNNRSSDWPNGGADGNLSNRVKIAEEFFRNTPQNRRVFLSFHADVQPNAPEAPLVLYYRSKTGRNVDTTSKKFAAELLPALGAGAYIKGQSLGVLRNNPARLKLLLELRNLAYSDHAWAMRFEQLRQRDAEKVVKGLLDNLK